MIKNLTTFLLIILPLSITGQQSASITGKYFPDRAIDFRTPTLSIDDDRLATYDEILQWIDDNLKGIEGVEVKTIGTTPSGNPIPVIIINGKGDGPHMRVWMQGLLHGNEPAGGEALLYLASELAHGKLPAEIAENLSVAILPVANPDGYSKNERRSADGFDLNRDQTKYADRVSIIIRRAFIDWNADLAFDFHEFQPTRSEYSQFGEKGASISYDVLFLPSGFLNIPEGLRSAAVDIFQKEAEAALDNNGYTHNFYFTADVSGDEMVLNKGAKSPQSSSTSYALSGAVSVLVETRGIGLGRTSFIRRTHSAYVVASSFLESAVAHREELSAVLEAAKLQTVARTADIIVTSEPSVKYYDLRLIDLVTGELIVKKTKTLDALAMEPTLIRSRPEGYIIEAGAGREAEILALLGIEPVPVKPKKRYEVESFLITDFSVDEKRWEGIFPATGKAELVRERRRFPEGSLYIDLSGSNANYAVTLLEPESANGFVSFRVTAAEEGSKLKIHRVIK